MASVSLTVTIDMSVIVPIVRRLAAAPRTPALVRHIDALLRDQGLVELRAPSHGSGFTCRAVPSIQLLRLLEQHEATR